MLTPELLRSTEPVLLHGLVRHWPMVQAARRSDAAFCDYLRRFGQDTKIGLWRGEPEIAGRFFYNAEFTGFNFQRTTQTFGALLDELLSLNGKTEVPALYLGSTELDGSFPGLRQENELADLNAMEPLISLWLSNRIQVAAHFDAPDNLACVVAGRRRFTLFPPEQVANLYVGPLDFTPAGQPVSLVDLSAPDFVRFPRYAEALKTARVFELEAGDALLIPSQWWHGVEGLDDINGLVNFWWRQSPAYMDTPLNTLMLALLTVRDLPPVQRDAWRALFDHYVFDANEQTAAHVPAAARGVLGRITPDGARQLRSFLLNRMNR